MKDKIRSLTITLYPTHYPLDVYICSSKKTVVKTLSETYGESKAYYDGLIVGSFCGIVTMDGVDRIVMVLRSEDPAIMAHEAVHATWHLSLLAGLNLDSKSQETQAYYVSYIMQEILKEY